MALFAILITICLAGNVQRSATMKAEFSCCQIRVRKLATVSDAIFAKIDLGVIYE